MAQHGCSWFASYLEVWSYEVTWMRSTSALCRLYHSTLLYSPLVSHKAQYLPHFSSPCILDFFVSAYPHMGFHMNCYADYPFYPSNAHVSAQISVCLADLSPWMVAHKLKFNSSIIELLFIPGDLSSHLEISLDNSLILPLVTARNLVETVDNPLSFSSHVANLSHSCRFVL